MSPKRDRNKWNLVENRLEIIIDPLYFCDRSTIPAQVNLVNMLVHYFNLLDPNLCSVQFYYPKYIEESFGLRRIFTEFDGSVTYIAKSSGGVDFFDDLPDVVRNIENFKPLIESNNDLLNIAIENKIPFILSNLGLSQKNKTRLKNDFNISVLDLESLQYTIESFLQGFFNYYKFDSMVYGIDAPDIAHAMSDILHRKLILLEDKVKKSDFSLDVLERMRSLIHNRYIDILVTIDKINFYKIQEQIFDIKNGVKENREPKFQGPVRYYLNYHLLLVWGYLDHVAWVLSDIFKFGYSPDKHEDQQRVGLNSLNKKKSEFFDKLKVSHPDLYTFVISEEFQKWLSVLSQLRHKNAHREMMSPGPLLQATEESQIPDEEIDAILYKDGPVIEKEISDRFPEIADNQKVLDRHHYRISKMEKILSHVAVVKEGILDPVARVKIDLGNIQKLTELLAESKI